MAIPTNELKYFDNGTPYGGVQGQDNTSNVLGEMKFWDGGMPYVYVFPTASGGASLIKTFIGLANASTKTVNGLANASIKTFNGLTNV